MKKYLFLPTLLLVACALSAQNLPVKTVTVFKNGKSLLYKSGKVPVSGGKYAVTKLPDALFGTFWVNGTGNELSSVFTAQDSMEIAMPHAKNTDLLSKNLGKPLRLYLLNGYYNTYDAVDAVCEKAIADRSGSELFVFKTLAGKWLTVNNNEIHRIEFLSAPDLDFKTKIGQKHLELRFKSAKSEQEIGLSYLTGNLGWTPVYRLELTDKNKGRLSLRAEIANDAEDLGDAELRLAVGVPNFAYASKPAILMNFSSDVNRYMDSEDLNPYRGNVFMNQSVNMSASGSIGELIRDDSEPGAGFAGSQAEDFYYYSIHPGDFPRFSRYQFPIFEADIVPTHFYECVLSAGTPTSYNSYKDARTLAEEKQPVFHYIEFKNNTTYPWTTGVVNILSQSGGDLQPVSQDLLPYSPAGATCKVKIAQTPEIKITHAEGDVDREENAKKFFSQTYDRVKIEAQLIAINYKNEPITLKIRRTLEGKPLASEQKWVLTQEQATLRVNPSFTTEWIIELKPGEERKWTYSYEVFVNL